MRHLTAEVSNPSNGEQGVATPQSASWGLMTTKPGWRAMNTGLPSDPVPRGAKRVATLTLRGFFAGKKESPILYLVHGTEEGYQALLDSCIVVEQATEVPPDGMTFIMSVAEGFDVYGRADALSLIFNRMGMKAKSVERVQKYLGSLLQAATATYIPGLKGLRIVVMSKEQAKTHDGLCLLSADLAALTGWVGMNVRRWLFSRAIVIDGNGVQGVCEGGLLKGFFRVDASLPPKTIVVSEVKSIFWLKDQSMLAWAPQDGGVSVKADTKLSLQSILTILWGVVKTDLAEEFTQFMGELLRSRIDNFDAYAEELQMGTDSDVDPEEADLEITRDQEVLRLAKAAGISPWSLPQGANAVLNAMARDIDPKSLSYPGNKFGKHAQVTAGRGYPQMACGAVIMRAYKVLGLECPDAIRELAAFERALPREDKAGRPICYGTKRTFTTWKLDPSVDAIAFIFRVPTGATSGTEVVIRYSPKYARLLKAAGVFVPDLQFMPSAGVFKKVWSDNEGGDGDDGFVWLLGKLAKFAVAAKTVRDEMLKEQRHSFLALDDEAKAFYQRFLVASPAALKKIRPEAAITVADCLVQRSALGGNFYSWELQEVKEAPYWLPSPVPAGVVDQELFMMANKPERVNPYKRFTSQAANAVMYGLAIMYGLAEVPGRLAGQRKAIGAFLACTDLSGCGVDPGNTGEGMEEANEHVGDVLVQKGPGARNVLRMLFWMSQVYGRNDSSDIPQVLSPVKSRMGEAIRSETQPGEFILYKGMGPDGLPNWETLIQPDLYKVRSMARGKKPNRVQPRIVQDLINAQAKMLSMVKERCTNAGDDLAFQEFRANLAGQTRGSAVAARCYTYAGKRKAAYMGPEINQERSQRQAVVDTAVASRNRSGKGVLALKRWANQPIDEGFSNVLRGADEVFAQQENADELKRLFRVGLITQFLANSKGLNWVKTVKGVGKAATMEGWSHALRADGIIPGREYQGLWPVMAEELVKFAKARNQAKRRNNGTTIAFLLGKNAEVKPQDVVGLTVPEIVNHNHVSVAWKGPDNPEQDERAGNFASTIAVARKRTVAKNNELSGVSEYAMAVATDNLALLNSITPNRCTAVEMKEVVYVIKGSDKPGIRTYMVCTFAPENWWQEAKEFAEGNDWQGLMAYACHFGVVSPDRGTLTTLELIQAVGKALASVEPAKEELPYWRELWKTCKAEVGQ